MFRNNNYFFTSNEYFKDPHIETKMTLRADNQFSEVVVEGARIRKHIYFLNLSTWISVENM